MTKIPRPVQYHTSRCSSVIWHQAMIGYGSFHGNISRYIIRWCETNCNDVASNQNLLSSLEKRKTYIAILYEFSELLWCRFLQKVHSWSVKCIPAATISTVSQGGHLPWWHHANALISLCKYNAFRLRHATHLPFQQMISVECICEAKLNEKS